MPDFPAGRKPLHLFAWCVHAEGIDDAREIVQTPLRGIDAVDVDEIRTRSATDVRHRRAVSLGARFDRAHEERRTLECEEIALKFELRLAHSLDLRSCGEGDRIADPRLARKFWRSPVVAIVGVIREDDREERARRIDIRRKAPGTREFAIIGKELTQARANARSLGGRRRTSVAIGRGFAVGVKVSARMELAPSAISRSRWLSGSRGATPPASRGLPMAKPRPRSRISRCNRSPESYISIIVLVVLPDLS